MSGCRIVVMLCDISPGFQVSILNIAIILFQFSCLYYNCNFKGTYTLQIYFQGCSQYFPITKDASKCEGGDSFIFGNYKITELETILSNDNYIEREFLLERTSKWDSPTQSCCGPFVGGEPQEKDTDMQVYQKQHYIILEISGNDCTNIT